MASLTVRQLDEALKKRLRLRAAKNGRSVEEEIRTILRAAARDGETFAARPARRAATTSARGEAGAQARAARSSAAASRPTSRST